MHLSPHSVVYAESESVFLGDGSISGDSLLIVSPILWSFVSMFVVHCFLSLIVFQSSLWGRERAGRFTLFFFLCPVTVMAVADP